MAMIEGIDCSYDPPAPAEITRRGRHFAVRYVSVPGHAKNLTLVEADGYRAAGIGIVIVFQMSKDRALGGEPAGLSDARSAERQVAALGGDLAAPIYFAVDFDVVTLARRGLVPGPEGDLLASLGHLVPIIEAGDPRQLDALPRGAVADLTAARAVARAGQMATVLSYVGAVASVRGGARCGPYGERDVIAHSFDARLCQWGWQTYAWSGGEWDPRAQLRQYQNNVRWDTGLVDYDRAMTDNYGQWHAAGGDWFSMATQADLDAVVRKVTGVAEGTDTLAERIAAVETAVRMVWYGSKLREADAHDSSPGSVEGLVAHARLIRTDLGTIKTALAALAAAADPAQFAAAVVAAIKAQGIELTADVDEAQLATDLLTRLGLQHVPPPTT
jgi:hypothetical protein